MGSSHACAVVPVVVSREQRYWWASKPNGKQLKPPKSSLSHTHTLAPARSVILHYRYSSHSDLRKEGIHASRNPFTDIFLVRMLSRSTFEHCVPRESVRKIYLCRGKVCAKGIIAVQCILVVNVFSLSTWFTWSFIKLRTLSRNTWCSIGREIGST